MPWIIPVVFVVWGVYEIYDAATAPQCVIVEGTYDAEHQRYTCRYECDDDAKTRISLESASECSKVIGKP